MTKLLLWILLVCVVLTGAIFIMEETHIFALPLIFEVYFRVHMIPEAVAFLLMAYAVGVNRGFQHTMAYMGVMTICTFALGYAANAPIGLVNSTFIPTMMILLIPMFIGGFVGAWIKAAS